MSDKTDHIHEQMLALSKDSRVVKRAHFIAAQSKRRLRQYIGVSIIILNVLIGSTLLDNATPTNAAVIIRILAVCAAALAAIQTFFNFQKDVEAHLSSGDTYGSINRKLGFLMAEYNDNTRNRADIISDFKALRDEYLKANADSKGCIPSDKDYERARAAIQKSEELEATSEPNV
jgi:conflict system pore-forming effector with SLATT domain